MDFKADDALRVIPIVANEEILGYFLKAGGAVRKDV
jgi:hypothetical protein